MLTLSNAPRNIKALAALSRNVRYRLALQTNLIKMSSPEAQQTWLSCSAETQAEMLFKSLQEVDAHDRRSKIPPALEEVAYKDNWGFRTLGDILLVADKLHRIGVGIAPEFYGKEGWDLLYALTTNKEE